MSIKIEETGTLKELNIKVGDIVQYMGGKARGFTPLKHYTCVAGRNCMGEPAIGPINEIGGCIPSITSTLTFRIVSRASDTPTLWRDMTPEEKGALLLGCYEGKVIEAIDPTDPNDYWEPHDDFQDPYAYRIKTEPKRETVTLYGFDGGWGWAVDYCSARTTHRITFDLIDGEPDCNSIKMKKL